MTQIACAIALGGNLGDPVATFARALAALQAHPAITVTARSPWYRTPPMGPPQPDYLNGCALLEVIAAKLDPAGLLAVLLAIEAECGRVRGERWGPRVLDLDLLLYGDRVVTDPGLTVPHPGLRDRAFVLQPLADIAPQWVDPITGQTIATLRHRIDCTNMICTDIPTNTVNQIATLATTSPPGPDPAWADPPALLH